MRTVPVICIGVVCLRDRYSFESASPSLSRSSKPLRHTRSTTSPPNACASVTSIEVGRKRFGGHTLPSTGRIPVSVYAIRFPSRGGSESSCRLIGTSPVETSSAPNVGSPVGPTLRMTTCRFTSPWSDGNCTSAVQRPSAPLSASCAVSTPSCSSAKATTYWSGAGVSPLDASNRTAPDTANVEPETTW